MMEKRKKLLDRVFSGLNWALWGYIISCILIVVYVYNLDPASIVVGDPYEAVTVKTFFGDKTFYPRLEVTPPTYKDLNTRGYIGMFLLLIVNAKAIIKDGKKAIKKFGGLKEE